MNAELLLDSTKLWHLAGWTMLHFLWLGTLVALAAGACRLVVWRAAPNVRYVTALACLVLLAVSPALIALWLIGNASPIDSTSILSPPAPGLASAPTAPGFAGGLLADDHQHDDPIEGHSAATSAAPVPAFLPTPTTSTMAPRAAAPTNPRQSRGLSGALDGNASSDVTSVATSGPTFAARTAAAVQTCVPYLPWVWLVGTPLTFTLLATGIIGTRRLRRASRPIVDGPIAELLARLAASLRVGRHVSIAVCERVAAPVLVGILRPIILLPPAALTGWSPDEIEMVLLHELSHVRRWDNAVNLAQRIVEAVLFFHPAVWLVSSWVRREREACCDAVVVGRTNRPHAYAELLVALAAQMKPSPFGRGPGEGTSRIAPTIFSPASPMAAGPLRTRIRRILQMEDDPMLVSGKSLVLVLAGLLATATLVVLNLPAIGQAEESPAATTQAATEPKEATTIANDRATEPKKSTAEERTTEDTESTEKNDSSADNSENITELRADNLQFNSPRGEVVIEAEDGQVKVRQNAPNAESRLETIAGEGFRATARQVELKDDGQVVLQGVQTIQRVDQSADASNNVADDWLKDVAFPSPKEREISRRAWKELGIKVVPASEAELEPVRRKGLAGGLKLLDFENRMNLAGPFVLTHIFAKEYAGGIASFEALRIALDELAAQPAAEVIKLEGTAKSGNVFTYSFRRPQRSTTAGAANPSRFPALADQKLADAVFRRLGWELEPIGAEDLARVKALGYDGGVRVAYAPQSGGFTNISYGHIQEGDILVGLHVWPTTNLAQVMEVLARDDLAELNPLKFYIVRQEQILSPTEPPKTRDKVQTGRISVRVDTAASPALAPMTSAPLQMPWDRGPTLVPTAPSTAAPTGSAAIPQPTAAPTTSGWLAPQPPAAPAPVPELPGLRVLYFHSEDSRPSREMKPLVERVTKELPGATFVQNDVANHTGLAQQMNISRVPTCVVVRDSRELGRITGVQSEQQLRDNIKSIIASANPPSPGGPGYYYSPPKLFSPVDRPALPTAPLVNPALPAAPPVSPALVPQPSPPPTAADPDDKAIRYDPDDKANFRYDGKTFDEWRTAWRTELSTEKRLEAVKALAAFGGSGYGQEAAEAVLEIAKQYDWQLVPGQSANPLQDAIVDALFGGNQLTPAIPAQAWFPRVMEGVRAGDKRSQQLMQWILMDFHQLGSDAEFATDPLLELSRSNDEALRLPATRALAGLDLEHKNPQIVARLKEMLDSSDPQQIIAALENVRVSSSALPFDASHLLFHTDEQVRRAARAAVYHLRPKQDKDLVQYLLEVLNDPQRADDHVEAIRALGALHAEATPAYAELEKRMLDRQQPLSVRIAAMTALERITSDGSSENRLREAFLEENKDRQDTPEFRAELQQLDQAMRAEAAAIP